MKYPYFGINTFLSGILGVLSITSQNMFAIFLIVLTIELIFKSKGGTAFSSFLLQNIQRVTDVHE